MPLDAGRPHEARQAAGDLDDGQPRVLFAVQRPEEDGEVEAEAGQHGEGPGGVDGERGERGQHLVAEVAGEGGPRGRLEVSGAHELGARAPRAGAGSRR